eukprot:TRINITY_DN1501_c0_g1_i1.p2 TRINITY_DN1501_c0_g1~~TRINITY_DN1501_c0_g1_i1.p2  ORF type:complete len:184 (+),score=6.12 TRINITY_DN1501_c0_g1_i1:102-653(+)
MLFYFLLVTVVQLTIGFSGRKLLTLQNDQLVKVDVQEVQQETALEMLQNNWKQWQNTNVTDYSYNVVSECMPCMEPFNYLKMDIRVCGEVILAPFFAQELDNIYSIFFKVENLLNSVDNSFDYFEISYDPLYHYPQKVLFKLYTVTYVTQSNGSIRQQVIGPDVQKIEITDFKVLKKSECIIA